MSIAFAQPDDAMHTQVIRFSDFSKVVPQRRAVSAPLEVPVESAPADRRMRRLRRFIIAELTALAIMLAIATAGVSPRFADETLTVVFRSALVAAAIAVALIPAIYYGRPNRRRRLRRERY